MQTRCASNQFLSPVFRRGMWGLDPICKSHDVLMPQSVGRYRRNKSIQQQKRRGRDKEKWSGRANHPANKTGASLISPVSQRGFFFFSVLFSGSPLLSCCSSALAHDTSSHQVPARQTLAGQVLCSSRYCACVCVHAAHNRGTGDSVGAPSEVIASRGAGPSAPLEPWRSYQTVLGTKHIRTCPRRCGVSQSGQSCQSARLYGTPYSRYCLLVKHLPHKAQCGAPQSGRGPCK